MTVSLIGAGSGDAQWLTVQAARLLAQAQVCLYDSLVHPSVLAVVSPTCTMIEVGKRGGGQSVPQRQICDLLVEYGRNVDQVVRLKGGDPSIFGRLNEEIEALEQAHIGYRIVPGVTAACGLAARGGFSLTERGVSRSVTFWTAHSKDGALTPPISEGTLVVYMGLGGLQQVVQSLLSHGRSEQEPAALLWSGGQKGAVFSTLGQIYQRSHQAVAPATLFVGPSISPRSLCCEPLAGRCFVVAAPAERSSSLASPLKNLGATVIELPAYTLAPLCWQWPSGDFDGLIFPSPTAVHSFVKNLPKDQGWRLLNGAFIAALGKSTAQALYQIGWPVDYVGQGSMSSLANVLPDGQGQLLCPGNAKRNEASIQPVRAKGWSVQFLDLFDEVHDDLPQSLAAAFQKGGVDGVVLTSSSQAQLFKGLKVKAFCIGEQTAQAARRLGLEAEAATEKSFNSLVSLILERNRVC